MPRQNRVLTIELRLLDVDDEQHEAFKDLMTETAKDLHAAATLLSGARTKPKIYHYGESYNIDISKLEPKDGV